MDLAQPIRWLLVFWLVFGCKSRTTYAAHFLHKPAPKMFQTNGGEGKCCWILLWMWAIPRWGTSLLSLFPKAALLFVAGPIVASPLHHRSRSVDAVPGPRGIGQETSCSNLQSSADHSPTSQQKTTPNFTKITSSKSKHLTSLLFKAQPFLPTFSVQRPPGSLSPRRRRRATGPSVARGAAPRAPKARRGDGVEPVGNSSKSIRI